jgi:hypothetical protein
MFERRSQEGSIKVFVLPLCLMIVAACLMLPFARGLRMATQKIRARRVTNGTSGTLRLKAGDNLQRALDAARPGETILLEAGATFTGPFTLPAKSQTNTDADWITIRTAANLPATGVRVTPADASAMPKLVSLGNGESVLLTAPGAHHFRFVGIEFMPRDASAFVYDVIALGNGTQRTLAEVPHHFIFDQCYIHAHPAQGVKRGIALNSAFTEIRNSYISDFKVVGQDSQAICGWNGPGPFKIINNYLEAAAENVMFGGAAPTIPNLVPSDIEVRGNHFYKPRAWHVGDPSYAGTHWSVKNLFELKNAQRVVFDGNVLENNWGDGQDGHAVLITPRGDQTTPQTVVQDIEFTNNVVRHSGSGIYAFGHDPGSSSQQSRRIRIVNNLFEDINGTKWGGDGRFLTVDGLIDMTVDHNTIMQSGNVIEAYGNPCVHFVFTNNLVAHNLYGIHGTGANDPFARYFPGGVFKKNVLVAGTIDPAVLEAAYPLGNYFPPSFESVKFVDAARGNYRLAGNSPLKGRATDKKDIGCDFAVPAFPQLPPPAQSQ